MPVGVHRELNIPLLIISAVVVALVALEQYKDGRRVDLVMSPLMGPLDDASIEQLAAFFAAQPHLHYTPIP
jgi:cytochrome c553